MKVKFVCVKSLPYDGRDPTTGWMAQLAPCVSGQPGIPPELPFEEATEEVTIQGQGGRYKVRIWKDTPIQPTMSAPENDAAFYRKPRGVISIGPLKEKSFTVGREYAIEIVEV